MNKLQFTKSISNREDNLKDRSFNFKMYAKLPQGGYKLVKELFIGHLTTEQAFAERERLADMVKHNAYDVPIIAHSEIFLPADQIVLKKFFLTTHGELSPFSYWAMMSELNF